MKAAMSIKLFWQGDRNVVNDVHFFPRLIDYGEKTKN